ncbi:MAG: alpha/beta fold hydrolase [Deltaproteobacteria bacterium]|nr:alpha/beta fold hydrolase [Deltaproteobacteria bacterium]
MRVGDRRLAYESYGSGRPLVLVHAFPFDGRMWRRTAEGLGGRCRVLVPDLRGFGGSDLGGSEPSIVDMADDVAALLDHLGIERAVVGGLSMGGYVALAFAARHRARLERLILADTRAAGDTDKARAGRADALALVEKEGGAALVERQLAVLLSGTAGESLRQEVRDLGRQSALGVCAALRALRDRPDRQAELGAIVCPTLVISGGEDRLSPPEEMAALARALPNAHLVAIPGAGHLSNLERPDEFVAAIADFLASEQP